MQQSGNFFRFIYGSRTYQHGLPALVAFDDFLHHRTLFAFERGIYHIGKIDALDRLVCGDFDNVKRINRAEFRFFRFCRARHARKFAVQTEIVLESDGGVRLVFASYFHALFRFDCLMQSVGIAAPDHKSAREFVDDDDFAVVHDIIFVALEKLVRFERLLNVMVQIGVRDFRDVIDTEESFRFLRAGIGEFHRFILAVYDVIPVLILRERLFAFGGVLRGDTAFFFLRSLVIRLFFQRHFRVIRVFFLFGIVLRGGFGKRFFVFLFALVFLGCFARGAERLVLFLFQFVVESAGKRAHEFIYLHIQIGRFFALAGNDERRSGFVD